LIYFYRDFYVGSVANRMILKRFQNCFKFHVVKFLTNITRSAHLFPNFVQRFIRPKYNDYPMRISIGNDHAGPDYKKAIVHWLQSQGHEVINHGTDTDASVDYPDFGHPVALDVAEGRADFGIVICGSGNGINMTVNKHQAIRSALCWTKEIAALARQHNDANIISIPARFTAIPQAVEMVATFLETPFEGGRHQNRVQKIACS
jgi:ribose 5-phosphate isomerase B